MQWPRLLWVGLFLAPMAACLASGEEDNTGFTPVDEPDIPNDSGDAALDDDASGTGGSAPGGSGGSTSAGGTAGSGTGGSGGSSGSGGTGGSSGGGSAGSGGTGGGSGGSNAGGTGGAGCVQEDLEPNDVETHPLGLGPISDCDGDGSTVGGTLDSSADKDWFSFHAEDTFGCSVNPTFTLQSNASAILCAYFSCDAGGNNVNCSSGSSVDSSPGGLKGCCTTSGSLQPSLDCSGLDEGAQVYVLVYSPSIQACTSYSVDYHY